MQILSNLNYSQITCIIDKLHSSLKLVLFDGMEHIDIGF